MKKIDMKGLMQRVITAIFFAAAVLGGLLGGQYAFLLLFVVITALCLWEFLSLTLQTNTIAGNGIRRVFGVFFGLIPIVLVAIDQMPLLANGDTMLTKAILLAIPLFFLVFIYELFSEAKAPFGNLAYLLLGIVYIGIPFALLVLIAMQSGTYSPNLILGMLFLTWANDSGAYFVGSKLGKTPLFPRISPNKTWEGSIGGLVLGLLVGWGLSFLFPEYTILEWLIIALIVVVFGALGDLVESMLKRSLKVKDSGHLLPGHGGFLDRFDAFIFVIPFVAAFVLWIR